MATALVEKIERNINEIKHDNTPMKSKILSKMEIIRSEKYANPLIKPANTKQAALM